MLATFADVNGEKLPDDAGEDSISLLPVLLGGESPISREVIFIQGDGKDDAIAVCSGQWKLIQRGRSDITELYDLTSDPGEDQNIADQHPEIVKRLTGALEKAERDGRTRPAGA